jgi:hypothetical protein
MEAVARTNQSTLYSRAAATAFHRLPVHGISGERKRGPIQMLCNLTATFFIGTRT